VLDFGSRLRLLIVQQISGEVLPLFGHAMRTPHADTVADRQFEDLFRLHYPRLVKTLFRLTGDSGQAEELASEAFCKLYQRRGWSRDNPAAWLYRAGVNLALDALRSHSSRLKREQQVSREAVHGSCAAGPLDELLAAERRARVRTVISKMKPIHGQVLLMGNSGFSCQEMAEVLGVRCDSLYTLISRAKAQFEKRYVGMFGGQQ
jgi:RNA polymerase sigma factor (sigma-70 family)